MNKAACDELIRKLRKPLYVYTLAWRASNKSEATRKINARQQIHKLIMEYVNEIS